MDSTNPLTRRDALKMIGGTTAGSSVLSGNAVGRSGARYEGFVYDPVTHRIMGRASGQFSSLHGQLVGNLWLGDEKFNMSKLGQIDAARLNGMQQSKYGYQEITENGSLDHQVRLSAVEDGVTGYLKTDSGKRAFSIVPKSRNPENLRELLSQTAYVNGSR